MKNTIELIIEASIKVSHESKLDFLKNDTLNVLENEHNYTNKELVERLEKVFTNANYAGDYKAGKLSFLLNDYLNNIDVMESLRKLLSE